MKHSILLILLLIICSCGQNRSGLTFSDSSMQTPQISQVSFSELKQKIITTNCIACHRQMATEDGISKWIVPGKPDESRFYIAVKEGTMPLGGAPLSTIDLEIVRNYIESVAIRTASKVTFEQVKNEILTPSCLGCHRSMNTEENLMKWININDPQNSRLYLSVKEQRMPKNAPPLTEAKLKLISDYLKNFKKGNI